MPSLCWVSALSRALSHSRGHLDLPSSPLALRKSEYCVSPTFDPHRDLSLADLHFFPSVHNPSWVDVRIKAHKTDRVSAWQHKRLFMPTDPAGRPLSQEEETDTFPYGSRSNPLPYGS